MRLEFGGLKRDQKIITVANLNPTCAEEKESIRNVAEKILKTGHRRIPITSKGKLVGIITSMDILDAFLRREDMNREVSTIMVREVIFCEKDESMEFVLQKFKISRRGGFPIVDEDEKVIGIVTERDFVRRFANVEFGVKVEDVMTKKPLYLKGNITILDGLKTIVNTRYRRIPLLEDGKLVGIVTAGDILRFIYENNFEHTPLLLQGSIFRKKVYSIDKNLDVSDAIKKMIEYDVGGLSVVDENGRLEGIITERDVLEEIY